MMIEGIGLDNTKSIVVILIEWGIVFFGTMMNISFGHYEPAKKLELFLYCAMGWMITFVLTDISAKTLGYGIVYLVLGGLSYFFGVIFEKMGEVVPIYHVYWHIFVNFGSMFIFIFVF